MLVNDIMYTGFKEMHVDEEKMLIDFSDHCLIQKLKNEKPIYKNLSWVK